jgi:hypothetical protein
MTRHRVIEERAKGRGKLRDREDETQKKMNRECLNEIRFPQRNFHVCFQLFIIKIKRRAPCASAPALPPTPPPPRAGQPPRTSRGVAIPFCRGSSSSSAPTPPSPSPSLPYECESRSREFSDASAHPPLTRHPCPTPAPPTLARGPFTHAQPSNPRRGAKVQMHNYSKRAAILNSFGLRGARQGSRLQVISVICD